MNVSHFFERAADKIDKAGWFGYGGRNTDDRPGQHYCALMAIQIVAGPGSQAGRVFERAIGGSIVAWNNTPGRTKEEVIAMLRAVAATERAREARLLPVIRETVPT